LEVAATVGFSLFAVRILCLFPLQQEFEIAGHVLNDYSGVLMGKLLPDARLPNLDCLFDEPRIGHKSIPPEIKKPTPSRKPGKELA
jgi:hypothetical protein